MVNVDCYLCNNGEEEGRGKAEVFLSMVGIPVQIVGTGLP